MKWRCFHCGEVFTDPRLAWHHFGDASTCGSDVPGCVDPLRYDEKQRLAELRDAREHAMKMQAESEANDEFESLLWHFQEELERLFGNGIRTPHAAWMRFEAAKNEAEDGRKAKDLIKDFALNETSQTSYAELKGSVSMDIPCEFLALCEFAEEMGVKLP
jgi:hypothetical protein